MAEQHITQADLFPSSLYFKALDVPEGKAREEVMARRGARLAALCRSAEALLRVAKTLRDSDRHGLVLDQTTLLEAATTDVESRADALGEDIRSVASRWVHTHTPTTGGFVTARGGWIPPVPMPPVPPDGAPVVPAERFGSIVIKRDVMPGRVTPADFAAAVEKEARKAGGLG